MAEFCLDVSRIKKFYERRFKFLREKGGAGTQSDNVSALFAQAYRFSAEQKIKPDLALALLHADLRRNVGEVHGFPDRFYCDVGLGGLTRWLRGAGYEAFWKPDLDDAAVIRETEKIAGTLITTDSLMTERGVLRDGVVPWIWVPSSLMLKEQLVIVLRELGLSLRDSRCMHCGGVLKKVEKASVIDRIPPRTALWLDEYFVCERCAQLFWRGTHWKKINDHLLRLTGSEAFSSTMTS